MTPDNPVRFTVDDAFMIHGRGVVLTGKMASGVIRVGDSLVLSGSGRRISVTIDSIEMFRKEGLTEARPFPPDYTGDSTYGFQVTGIDHKNQVKPGDILQS